MRATSPAETGAAGRLAARMLEEGPGLPGDDAYLAARSATQRRCAGPSPAIRAVIVPAASSIPPAGRMTIRACCGCQLFAMVCTAAPGPAGGRRGPQSVRRTPWDPASLSRPRSASAVDLLRGLRPEHDTELTGLLLEAGAGTRTTASRSISRRLESLACTRLLFQPRPRIEANAMYRVLDPTSRGPSAPAVARRGGRARPGRPSSTGLALSGPSGGAGGRRTSPPCWRPEPMPWRDAGRRQRLSLALRFGCAMLRRLLGR